MSAHYAKTEIETQPLTIDQLKFDEKGLIPAIVQSADDGSVLMLAYMDKIALEKTVASGRTWFFSRSRNTYWMKGEESGNVQEVVSVAYDCDGDTILVTVNQKGDGCACHTGEKSCFYRTFNTSNIPFQESE